MTVPIVLASGSAIRADLLRRARVPFRIDVPRIDEDALRMALMAENVTPRDLSAALAEMKARRIADKMPDRVVLGCDQVLELDGRIFSKPASPEQAAAQLAALQDKRHSLLSAAVIIENGHPVWRHVGQVRLTMRPLTPAFISAYVGRNWDSIRHAVGCYKLEEEGVALFSAIDGDYFNVLGMPLIELLNYLALRGLTET